MGGNEYTHVISTHIREEIILAWNLLVLFYTIFSVELTNIYRKYEIVIFRLKPRARSISRLSINHIIQNNQCMFHRMYGFIEVTVIDDLIISSSFDVLKTLSSSYFYAPRFQQNTLYKNIQNFFLAQTLVYIWLNVLQPYARQCIHRCITYRLTF